MTTDLDCPHIMGSYSAGVAWYITYIVEPSEWTWRFAASVLTLTVKEYYKCGQTAFGRQTFLYISLGTGCEDTPLAESTLGPLDYTCEYPDYSITNLPLPKGDLKELSSALDIIRQYSGLPVCGDRRILLDATGQDQYWQPWISPLQGHNVNIGIEISFKSCQVKWMTRYCIGNHLGGMTV